jgi:lipopolysaccharide/colanic/teichoic acid biosynthesis glycosyltransferase
MRSVFAPVYKRVIKRIFDLLLGLVALPFIALATLVIAPLIYFEDKGPVFYNAPRVGKNRSLFKMYKFRTMSVGAPDLKMEDGSTYNAPDDPRVTKIGAWLRKTSLDELPQILNIIKGDMSFIGPRPDLENEVALYFDGEDRKLAVKPGISGYAQVYGRNALAWHDRIALDVYYVEHQSFILDVKIFFKTFGVVFSGEGVFVENGSGNESKVDGGADDKRASEGAADSGGTDGEPKAGSAGD